MQQDYLDRINKAFWYIDENLEAELTLKTVAAAAYYSPFHLHRLFKAVTNETLNSYITRKRIERSAILLIHHKNLSIAHIATKYGFNSDSVFSRTFKKIYGQSPSQFRQANAGNLSKISKEDSKNGKANYISRQYLRNITKLKKWIAMNAKIKIADCPEMNLVYMTQIGEKGIEETFQQMLKWAVPKGVLSKPGNYMCRVFHDSFKVTEAEKVRMSIGLASVNSLFKDEEVSASKIEAGKYIVGSYEIGMDEFENAWNALFIWMSENGYKKDDRNPFELYRNNPNEHPGKKFQVDFFIPVK